MKKFVTFCLLVIMPMTLAAHNRDGHCERRGLPRASGVRRIGSGGQALLFRCFEEYAACGSVRLPHRCDTSETVTDPPMPLTHSE